MSFNPSPWLRLTYFVIQPMNLIDLFATWPEQPFQSVNGSILHAGGGENVGGIMRDPHNELHRQ